MAVLLSPSKEMLYLRSLHSLPQPSQCVSARYKLSLLPLGHDLSIMEGSLSAYDAKSHAGGSSATGRANVAGHIEL
jgi:hypothetical protein